MRLVEPTNLIGLDEKDEASKDDIVVTGEMHVPVNKPVIVRLRSKDVIHSFHLPYQRVKQDAVPGLSIEVTFTPNRADTFEIACAELCGNNHYKMKGTLVVDASESDFEAWLKTKLSEHWGLIKDRYTAIKKANTLTLNWGSGEVRLRHRSQSYRDSIPDCHVHGGHQRNAVSR
jgi:heme/copper-type cytochrome/quinol oxidase subunit 2